MRTGRTVRVAWPAGAPKPAAGTYKVRVHAKDPYGATLRRSARASGRASLVVVTPPTPKPAAPPPPASPQVRAGGVFPVQGAHTYGDGLGADRDDHRHQGADVLAAEGTPLVAPIAATVARVEYQADGAGHYVVLDGADGRSFFFAHMKAGSITVAEGQALAMGAAIGQVGSSGRSSGPHLHFEVWEGGWRRDKGSRFIDPLPQLRAWDGL